MTARLPGSPRPGRQPDHARRAVVIAAVERHGGNCSAAARELKCLPSTVRSYMLRMRTALATRPLDAVSRMLPRSMRARVTLRLIEDARPGVIERRRADCARLSACEAEWIEVHRGAETNARCPAKCGAYKAREAKR